MKSKPWYVDQKLRQTVEEAITAGYSYREVSALVDGRVSPKMVSVHALKRMHIRKREVEQKGVHTVVSLDLIDTKIREAQEALDSLRTLREQYVVRYRREDDNVFISGLYKIEVCLNAKSCLTWLTRGGAAELRAFLVKSLNT